MSAAASPATMVRARAGRLLILGEGETLIRRPHRNGSRMLVAWAEPFKRGAVLSTPAQFFAV